MKRWAETWFRTKNPQFWKKFALVTVPDVLQPFFHKFQRVLPLREGFHQLLQVVDVLLQGRARSQDPQYFSYEDALEDVVWVAEAVVEKKVVRPKG